MNSVQFHPGAVFSATLVVSLLLWSPVALAGLRGDVSFAGAGLRWLTAFVVARFVLGSLARLVAAYRAPH